MNAGTKIRVETDTATPALRKLLSSLTPERLAARCGPALQRLTQEHLAALGPNKHGYPSTHFWAKFVPNVRWESDEHGVSISILPVEIRGRSVGLRQPIYGGPIFPQAAGALAIPISPISYGHIPADFPGLILVRTAKGAFLCLRTGEEKQSQPVVGHRQNGDAGVRGDDDLVFLFRLSRGVMQDPNPAVLPSDEEYLSAARAAIGGAN